MTWVDKITVFTLRFPKNISGNFRYWNWVLWVKKDFSLRSSLYMTILILWNLSWSTVVGWCWLALAPEKWLLHFYELWSLAVNLWWLEVDHGGSFFFFFLTTRVGKPYKWAPELQLVKFIYQHTIRCIPTFVLLLLIELTLIRFTKWRANKQKCSVVSEKCFNLVL